MQATRIALAVALAAALGGTLVTTGCASTSTQSSAGEMIDDSVITTKVKAAFVEDKTVAAMNINVETYKGTVQLSGFANSASEMSRAVEIARSVKGVKSVKNDIRLKG
jgi:osmotically-inducible protein OsmY